ncbi:C40 family peptidase [Companilactobacillus metriopterae]|uniref:C40 family peptidase n=1 Tax=Companilactobacillus metriopterae TaxID=1909267 RepID=UPI00100B2D73|nr:C40 family peptidase [Companilactobacillus metriopterae]
MNKTVKRSFVSLTTAAALATTAAGLTNLSNNESKTAQAAVTEVTTNKASVVRTNVEAQLYTSPSATTSRAKTADRSVAVSTDWAVVSEVQDEAGNLWYAVGNNAWLKASDVTVDPAPAVTQAATTTQSVIDTAQSLIGTPYVWGGKTTSGFDCSGFVGYVYQQATGKSIGSYTVAQESAGSQISVQNASAGDLLFWGNQGSSYHVAIYLGNNQYIDAPKPGQSVSVRTMSSYFMPSFAVHVDA